MLAPDMDDEMTLNDIIQYRNALHKVFSIVMCQLLITIAFMTMATFHNSTRLCIESHPYLSIIASIITLGILIVLASSKNVHRKNPINFIFLFMVTLVLSFLLATSVSRYYPEQVLLALSLASFICFALTIFALQTKINLTMMGGFLKMAVIVVLVTSIVNLFFLGIIIMTLIIACLGAIIYSLYIIYVIQILINEYFISPSLYIYVTFTTYEDLTEALVYILTDMFMIVLDDEHFVA